MNLRSRLIAALLMTAVAISIVAFCVLYFQQRYINNQIDSRLTRLSSVTELIITQTETTTRSQVLNALWEGYVGVFESDGALKRINAPKSDPTLQPDVDLYTATISPKTYSTISGKAKYIRSMTVALSDGRVALVGLDTTEGDEVVAQLRVTLMSAVLLIYFLLGLTVWWLYRFAFKPIRLMTQEADAIADGTRSTGLTPTIKTSQEAIKLEQSINRAIAVTQLSEARMRRFLADASHELRTPLTSLQGYSSLYLSGALRSSEEITDAMNRIHDESLRMARLVNDLLHLSNLNTVSIFSTTEFTLLPLLENLKRDIFISHPSRLLEINCEKSIQIKGDSDLIFQAILNLVSNGIRHTGDHVSIRINARPTTEGTRIEVTDSGHGIAAEHLPHLFDRFYRIDKARDSNSGGSGLGLAIVAEIVQLHGGTYGATSIEGTGSTFWLEFPH